MEPKTTGKRIVSKAEYARVQADRALGGSFGALFAFLSALCVLLAFCGCGGVIACLWFFHSEGVGVACVCLFWIVLTGSGAYYLRTISSVLIKEAVETDPGIPLTRANTADLPAPDSLVRASSQPVQTQEAVLLRAAKEDVKKHEEQLVRPVNGQE